MKLKTSFFEPTILKKDLTRFAPLWGLYGLFALLTVLLIWDLEGEAARFANNAPELFLSMGILNFLYAPIAAFVLFGDLFKSRMCNALHALPLRREGWFLTHLTAGMLFCILPNGLAALLAAALLQEYAWLAFLWLALMVLQYIFFFGTAAFACHCSGNYLGAIAVYGIINFLAVILGWLAITFYQPLLYGVQFDFYEFAKHCPVVRFTSALYLESHYDNMPGKLVFEHFIGEDWRYLGISSGLGLVFLALALLIYRVRNLESAGDLIAFKPAAPVFLVLYTFLAGTMLHFIASLTGTTLQYIFLAIGLAVGFFTGRMLLERRVKVFQGKNFLLFGILVAVFYASLGITALDPAGITRYVPEADQISYVNLGSSHYIYDLNRNTLVLSDPADIEKVVTIHQECIEYPGEETSFQSTYLPVYICYHLKNGTTLERYYYADIESATADTVQSYFSSEAAVFDGMEAETVLKNLRMIEVYSYADDMPSLAVATSEDYLDLSYYTDKYGDSGKCLAYLCEDPSQDPVLQGLFEAMKKDCGSGEIAQSGQIYNKAIYAHINLKYYLGTSAGYLDIEIFEGCENTIAYLKSLQTQ